MRGAVSFVGYRYIGLLERMDPYRTVETLNFLVIISLLALDLFGQVGSGSDLFDQKVCNNFCKLIFKIVQFLFDYKHISLEYL